MTFRKPIHRRRSRPHPFSNDKWSEETVAQLDAGLRSQTTPKEHAAAVVIGSGGIPYIFSRLSVARLWVADISSEVIDASIHRKEKLDDYDSWEPYEADIQRSLATSPTRELEYESELRIARRSGLLGSFAATQAGAARTDVRGLPGDIMKTAPKLSQQLIDIDNILTFIHLTNVADTIGNSPAIGRTMLWGILRELPMASDAVIVDSTFTLVPTISTPESYTAMLRDQGDRPFFYM